LILIPYKKYYVETEKTIEEAMSVLYEEAKLLGSYKRFFTKLDGRLHIGVINKSKFTIIPMMSYIRNSQLTMIKGKMTEVNKKTIIEIKFTLHWISAVIMVLWLGITGFWSMLTLIGLFSGTSHVMNWMLPILFFGGYAFMQISFMFELYKKQSQLNTRFNSRIYKKED
jgi:hypothetical protein